MHNVHTKTAVLNALLILRLVLIRNVVLQAEEWSSKSQTIVVNMSVKVNDRPANKVVGEGYHGQMPL